MLKTLTLLKRRPDIDRAEFIRRYETGHRLIGEKVLRGHAQRYVRRYLNPVPNPVTGEVEEPAHDVVMEMWFADEAAYQGFLQAISDPVVMAEIVADEETLFDRAHNRFFLLEEHESSLD